MDDASRGGAVGKQKTAERDAPAVKEIPLSGSAVSSQSDASIRDIDLGD